MIDPFPIEAPAGFEQLGAWIGDKLNLDTLHLHLHEILIAFALYHTICSYISPAISPRIFPKTFAKFDDRTKLNWHVHVVSFVQSILITSVGLWVLLNDEELADMDFKERVFGYTGATGMVQALGCGYFLWDLWISLINVNVFGPGLLAHAASAFWVYGMGFRPFTSPYAPIFVLYELSSPFLNIHWALDKLDMTGSNTQLINGIFLMSSFFGSRLIFGLYQSYSVFSDIFRSIAFQQTTVGSEWLYNAKEDLPIKADTVPGGEPFIQVMRYAGNKHIPYWYAATYLSANVVLTLLNFYWFNQMIKTIRKRFDPPFGTRTDEKKAEPVMGRGLDSQGVKSVEVSAQKVRRRGKNNKDGEEVLNKHAA